MIKTIEFNNKKYEIIDDKELDGIIYTLFLNIEDDEDFCFRKTKVIDGEEYYVSLDNEEEFYKVINLFAE